EALLRRSSCIFFVITLFSVSSLIYINHPNELWSAYQFSVNNVLLGLVLLICYVMKAETNFQQMFDNKPKTSSDGRFSTFDSMSKPLNFITKQDPEVENEGSSRLQSNFQQSNLLGSEHFKPTLISKSQGIAATFESCMKTTSSFCDSQVDISSTSKGTPHPQLEFYNNSPQNCRNYTGISSPDILSSKVCVELDLVASSLRSSNRGPCLPLRSHKEFPIEVTPEKAIAGILETEIVDHHPGPRNCHLYRERTQPDGHDGGIIAETTLETVEEEIETDTVVCTDDHSASSVVFKKESEKGRETVSVVQSDKLDGMLDSISQDLEYLLNRTDVPPTSSVKRVPASPKHVVLLEIDDLAESVTLRTNC
ncbi:hypothetical protein JTB14_038077, partial [Gonioctena quinquepunctata]